LVSEWLVSEWLVSERLVSERYYVNLILGLLFNIKELRNEGEIGLTFINFTGNYGLRVIKLQPTTFSRGKEYCFYLNR